MNALLQALVDAPTLTRCLYPRGGFDGLEPNELQVLVALHLHSDRIVTDLVNQLQLGQGTVSTALASLHERGLVRPAVDRRDARRQRQRITPAGRRLVQHFASQARKRLSTVQLPSAVLLAET